MLSGGKDNEHANHVNYANHANCQLHQLHTMAILGRGTTTYDNDKEWMRMRMAVISYSNAITKASVPLNNRSPQPLLTGQLNPSQLVPRGIEDHPELMDRRDLVASASNNRTIRPWKILLLTTVLTNIEATRRD